MGIVVAVVVLVGARLMLLAVCVHTPLCALRVGIGAFLRARDGKGSSIMGFFYCRREIVAVEPIEP